jgi:cytochrome c oxidase subunit 2
VTRRRLRAALVVVALTAAAGCGGSSPSMLDHHGPEAKRVAGVWWLMFGLAAVVYVIVAGLIFVALLRGRRARNGTSRLDETAFIVVGGVIVPVLILAVLAVVTVTTTRALRNPERGELAVHVTGNDWWWDVTYGGTNVRTANEIHVPVGRTVDVALSSADVVHSFWVPQLAGKVDVIPGQTNHLRFRASQAGTYLGECAEFCSLGHALMRFVVIAQPPDEFERWLTRRGAMSTAPTSEEEADGERVFMSQSCAGCHTIRDTQATGRFGPDLTDFGARGWIGAITLRNTRSNLEDWIRDSQHAKPGNLMPPIRLSRRQLDAVVAYLEGLK